MKNYLVPLCHTAFYTFLCSKTKVEPLSTFWGVIQVSLDSSPMPLVLRFLRFQLAAQFFGDGQTMKKKTNSVWSTSLDHRPTFRETKNNWSASVRTGATYFPRDPRDYHSVFETHTLHQQRRNVPSRLGALSGIHRLQPRTHSSHYQLRIRNRTHTPIRAYFSRLVISCVAGHSKRVIHSSLHILPPTP